MFFIYGIKKAKIKSYSEAVMRCSSCNSIDLRYEVYRDYFHLFWIPLFPADIKEVRGFCGKCKAKNLPPERVKHFETTTKTPIYLFSGLIIVISLFAFLVYSNITTRRAMATYIVDPKVGDIYMVVEKKDDSQLYSFIRVIKVTNDSLYFYLNNYQYSGFVSRLDENDSFVPVEISNSRKHILQLWDKNIIHSIERDYDDDTGFKKIGNKN